jgi:stringent starvation protein B
MSDILSNRPYLILALHQSCTVFGFTRLIAVFLDKKVTMSMKLMKKDEIVLNLSLETRRKLNIGNDWINFQARFG